MKPRVDWERYARLSKSPTLRVKILNGVMSAGRDGMEIEITAVNQYPMLGKGLLRVSCERHEIIVNKLGIFPRKLLEI